MKARLISTKKTEGVKSPLASQVQVSTPLSGSINGNSFAPSPNNERIVNSTAYMRNMLHDMIKDKAQ